MRIGNLTGAAALLGPALGAMFLLAACGQNADPAADETGTAIAEVETVGDAPVLASDLIIAEQTPTLEFRWRLVPEAAEYPTLFARLRAAALRDKAALETTARETAQARTEAGLEAIPVAHDQMFETVFENRALLNIRTEIFSDTGGAHPNHTLESIIWDRRDDRQVSLPDLFVNWPEVRDALSAAYCAKLDDMRAERRGGAALDGEFGTCPDLAAQHIALRGPRGMAPEGITVLFSPYAAGPYAEGAYEVEVDFDDAVRAALKARFQG
ncbi:DUF3298 domain-containing protein [Pacificimonas sp. WHA3]|uniref:DUF3298 domain-containing protein n=1 Tax=Pacificimonas pallii TaxID=2827236 RepID=A0ABS6SAU3_9SPHN|nr:DUF3298 and DUF4163 domain-containing protein [Pacificimonas pallii]MBV7255530.1 DUF3298 domain-containing protein [Pacificimonas pallii]